MKQRVNISVVVGALLTVIFGVATLHSLTFAQAAQWFPMFVGAAGTLAGGAFVALQLFLPVRASTEPNGLLDEGTTSQSRVAG